MFEKLDVRFKRRPRQVDETFSRLPYRCENVYRILSFLSSRVETFKNFKRDISDILFASNAVFFKTILVFIFSLFTAINLPSIYLTVALSVWSYPCFSVMIRRIKSTFIFKKRWYHKNILIQVQ